MAYLTEQEWVRRRKAEGKRIEYDWKGAYWQDWWGRKHYYYDSTQEDEKKEEEEDQEQAPAAGALGTGQPEWQPAFPTNYVPVNAGAGKTNNAISSSPAVYPPAADDDIPQTASPDKFSRQRIRNTVLGQRFVQEAIEKGKAIVVKRRNIVGGKKVQVTEVLKPGRKGAGTYEARFTGELKGDGSMISRKPIRFFFPTEEDEGGSGSGSATGGSGKKTWVVTATGKPNNVFEEEQDEEDEDEEESSDKTSDDSSGGVGDGPCGGGGGGGGGSSDDDDVPFTTGGPSLDNIKLLVLNTGKVRPPRPSNQVLVPDEHGRPTYVPRKSPWAMSALSGSLLLPFLPPPPTDPEDVESLYAWYKDEWRKIWDWMAQKGNSYQQQDGLKALESRLEILYDEFQMRTMFNNMAHLSIMWNTDFTGVSDPLDQTSSSYTTNDRYETSFFPGDFYKAQKSRIEFEAFLMDRQHEHFHGLIFSLMAMSEGRFVLSADEREVLAYSSMFNWDAAARRLDELIEQLMPSNSKTRPDMHEKMRSKLRNVSYRDYMLFDEPRFWTKYIEKLLSKFQSPTTRQNLFRNDILKILYFYVQAMLIRAFTIPAALASAIYKLLFGDLGPFMYLLQWHDNIGK